MKAKPIVISAPSAAGKTSIRDALLVKLDGIVEKVITVTTRLPREGEVDGIDYIFLSLEDFNKKIEEGDFIEYTNVYGNMYGSLKSKVDEILDQDKYPVIILDTEGKKKFEQVYPEFISAFILPGCTKDELETRLRSRNTSEEDIISRLMGYDSEIEESKNYDIIIHNDSDIETAVNELVDDIKKLEGKSLDKIIELFQTCSEPQAYFLIEGLVNMMVQTNMAIQQGVIEADAKLQKELAEIKESVMIGINFTKRFGVERPFNEAFDKETLKSHGYSGTYLTPSQEYNTWYQFWFLWKQGLSQERWAEVDKALIDDSPNIPHLPSKKWNEE